VLDAARAAAVKKGAFTSFLQAVRQARRRAHPSRCAECRPSGQHRQGRPAAPIGICPMLSNRLTARGAGDPRPAALLTLHLHAISGSIRAFTPMAGLGNTRLLERLRAEGLITAEQQEAALNQARMMDERIEEALLDVAALDEPTLLKFLASSYRTRFVSTERLAKADIDRRTLDKLPRKLAEQETVFPVLFDAQQNVLSVVTPDPENGKMLQEVQLVSGAKEVRAFVGRPRAVRAAIAKAHNGAIHASANLDREAHQQFTNMLDVYERQLVTD